MADTTRPSFIQRIRAAWQVLAGKPLTPVAVGKEGDGINRRLLSSGSEIDRPYGELLDDIGDSLDAWRKHPFARRIVNLITAYVIGDGIQLSSKYTPFQRFIDEFWNHSKNRMILRQAEWCDELTRSGELFLVIFTNPKDGMSHIRAIPASRIDQIEWKDGDYETELRYHEINTEELTVDEGKWWHSFDHPKASDPETPIMLHFAINRPVGALRGEGELNSILPWLRRYSRWLEDRIRLNAGLRSFLWIVYAPARLKEALRARYAHEPEPGSIIIAEQDAERWEAVSPTLHAADAAEDGRAIRWMIATGGPGTALTDFGEAADANQATATVMVDIRRRFLQRRQAYFVWMLSELTLKAYERSRGIKNANRRSVNHDDIIVKAPDISSEDNATLAAAARDLSNALTLMQTLMGDSKSFRELALRLFSKFTEEDIAKPVAEAIVNDGETDRIARRALEEQQVKAEIEASKQKAKTPAAPK